MAKLVLHQPDGAMRDIKLDRDRITIGRRADNDVCLPFPAVSADHAEIITVVADSFLHDLGSTNGTLVNGSRISKHFLRNHDKIDIGLQQLIYLMNEAEMADPLPHDHDQEVARISDPSPNYVSESSQEAVPESEAGVSADSQNASVDELLTDLMKFQPSAPSVLGVQPALSIVPNVAFREASATAPNGNAGASAQAIIKVLSGPNAGQSTAMTKTEFVLGKQGVQLAAIRHGDHGYRLVPLDGGSPPSVNGNAIDREGRLLASGDTIDVAGVKLLFEKRA